MVSDISVSMKLEVGGSGQVLSVESDENKPRWW